jgi:hypothetical protein
MNSWESACKHSLRKILTRTSNQYYALLCSWRRLRGLSSPTPCPSATHPMHVSRAHRRPCITPHTAHCCACLLRWVTVQSCCLLRWLTMRSRLLSLPSRMADVPAELPTPLPLHARRVLLQAAARTYEGPSSTLDADLLPVAKQGGSAPGSLGLRGRGGCGGACGRQSRSRFRSQVAVVCSREQAAKNRRDIFPFR